MGPRALGQTIAVVDKSGKVISTSKTLLGIFKEAKSAYKERKAEIIASRQADVQGSHARRALEDYSFGERRPSQHSSPTSERRGSLPYSGSKHRHGEKQRTHSNSGIEGSAVRSPRRHTHAAHSATPPQSPSGLSRRHTVRADTQLQLHGMAERNSPSSPGADIDMDLAYGDLPPPTPVKAQANVEDMRPLMLKVTTILDEAHCLQYSVTTMISSLQKNPDALAAVALTLAEISNLASKASPGVLTAMKGSFPSVMALLASPQFMIAAGVGVGVVVVALGGYKIIKKIKARRAEDESMADLQEIGGDMNHIEAWRRGIADAEAGSVATSVDGEFITPEAIAIRERTEAARSEKTSKSRSGSKKEKSSKGKDKDKEKKKHKKEGSSDSGALQPVRPKKHKSPSPLRLLLK